jgi:methyltransferase-like protein/2-polyprenyl-3-methyl-5-hydroxy-6-metoxy-1,4-benzoquinol methylase
MAPMTGLDVSTIVARTSRSYDALPYTSDPFPSTHPSLVGAIARLFGLDAAPLAQARVLELGCAAGGNIIPLAARHPHASFVGLDLSSAQVAAARARIADLRLSNIEIRHESFSELSAFDSAFDYIICHGVYSWVPGPLRETILRTCRENLSPRGVALISYNVLPGWRMLQALRDCFLLHAAADADPRQRVAQARALLQLLPQACPDAGAYRDFLVNQADRLLKSSDEYLAHEFLEEVNEPCSFREFVDAARGHGLAFLAEAELPSMILANYPPNMAAMVQKAGGNQLLATEQYIDMVSGRTFRHTLLVSAARAPQIDRRLSSERVEGLHFIGVGALELTRAAGGVTLAAPAGRRLHTDSGPLAEALARFVAAFPGSSSVDDLVQALPAAARNADGRALVREGLLNMVINGLATARLDAVPAAARPGTLPVACPMVRAEAARGAATTVNLRHERVALESFAQLVLPLLDGSRDPDAISTAIAEGGRDGRLAFTRDGAAVDDPDERMRIASGNLQALLPALARAALLLA